MGKLLLFDGHSLAFRAFFALPPDLATTTGQPSNAVYGFTSMLLKAIQDERPDHIAVAFDTPERNFRFDVYADYKAGRSQAPDNFRSQLPLVNEVLRVLRIPVVTAPGWEADDALATIAVQAAADGQEVRIVTGDRDIFQIVDDRIQVLYTRRGISDMIRMGPAEVLARYGIRADQYVDFASLRGDPSDNLPGVRGVGEKTAAKLLVDFGNLEGIYANLDALTPRLREALAGAEEDVFRNRRVATLVRDLDLPVAWTELVQGPWEEEEVRDAFRALEFKILLERLFEIQTPGRAGWADAPPERELVVAMGAEVDATLAQVLAAPEVVLAPAWEGDAARGRLLGLVVLGGDEAAWVPLAGAPVPEPLRQALADPDLPLMTHGAKAVARALRRLDAPVTGLDFDTELAAYLLDPGLRSYSLGSLAARYLQRELVSPDSALSGQGTLDFGGGPDPEDIGRQAVTIADLAERFRRDLETKGLQRLYVDVELPLVPVLADMEEAGVALDMPYLAEMSHEFGDRLRTLEHQIHDFAGVEFNVNSTKQLQEVLYDKLGLPVLKRTPKGVPSTDASVLEKLAIEHPMVERLLEYRELEKLRGTYIDALPPLADENGRVHATFNQTIASTGRLSSEQPNLQNIPVRTELGRRIRRAFIAPPGRMLVVADYSQIELRILAHLSGDEVLCAAFRRGADIHGEIAAVVFGVPQEQVDSEMRNRVKFITYGLVYGMEAYGLASRMGTAPDEARTLMEAYFEKLPTVRQFMRAVVDRAKADGFTETMFGRRRYLPELSSNQYQVRSMGERMALNAPIQGAAADITKIAMVDVHRALAGLDARLILQVHDELLVEAADEEVEKVSTVVREAMEGAAALSVPLEVGLHTGRTWAEAKS